MTHICVDNLTIIDSDNGLSPGRCQAIIWTNAGIWWIRPLRTSFGEILIEIQTFWFKKMRLNVSSTKWRPFCLGHNVLTSWLLNKMAFYWLYFFYEYVCILIEISLRSVPQDPIVNKWVLVQKINGLVTNRWLAFIWDFRRFCWPPWMTSYSPWNYYRISSSQNFLEEIICNFSVSTEPTLVLDICGHSND